MGIPRARTALGAVVGLALAGGIRLGSAWEVRARNDDASVRLSWSARPERIEQCRRLSDEELAARPAHMRLRMECTGSFARYRLTVSVDGQVRSTDTIRGGGLRHDRPIHVFQEISVPFGSRHLELDLVRLDSAATAPQPGVTTAATGDTLLGLREAREADERRRRDAEAMPSTMRLDTIVTLPARRVLLVTWDGAMRRLVARSEP